MFDASGSLLLIISRQLRLICLLPSPRTEAFAFRNLSSLDVKYSGWLSVLFYSSISCRFYILRALSIVASFVAQDDIANNHDDAT